MDKIVVDIKSGQTTPTIEVEKALEKIKESESLNIFTEVLDKQALQQAKDLEDRITKNEEVGKLAGVVFCVKDNFLYKDTKTTAAAPFLLDFTAPYTATCLQKLLDEDAILLGKTNLDSFAHGTSTENSYFGPTKNPHNKDLTPGGSSGGSAAAVAYGICPFSLGTDTGGSVRLPASFCGVFGFKPTYGLLSRYGIVAMASSTDCVSPITRDPLDAIRLMDILKGRDPLDATTLINEDSGVSSVEVPAKLRVGIIKEFHHNLAPDVEESFNQSLKSLTESTDWQLEEISIPNIELALACYYVLVSAEVSSNLSRYNGLLYGRRVGDEDWEEVMRKSRQAGFMAENKRRIMLGAYVLSQGYYEAYYQRAQKLRTLLRQEFEKAFAKVDVLLSPVSPTPAFKLGDKTEDPLQMYLADLMTVAPSLVGIPAASLPLKSPGLPVGLQIMTPQKTDGLNLKIAEDISKL